MSLLLQADNRALTEGAKYSYLSTNYASAVGSFVVINSAGFSVDDYLLLGEFGGETSEIVKIQSIDSSTHTLTLTANTIFAHSESTKVTILKYNQVKFYHTATATYATTSLLATVDIQADDLYTKYNDSSNSTGFGWFIFFNSTTSAISTNSNAIPYAGFEEGSVKEIMDAFFSTLNNKEMRLISVDDAFRWLNEGAAISQNELNMVNDEYNVETPISVSAVSGTQEYDLSAYKIGNIIRVVNGDGVEIDHIDIKDVPSHDANASASDTRYYYRGTYIGFTPEPTSSVTYSVYYESKSTVLTSFYDNIDLPNNNFYFLVDFMLYRASEKLPRIGGAAHLDKFNKDLQRMKLTSFKQHDHRDSFEPDDLTII